MGHMANTRKPPRLVDEGGTQMNKTDKVLIWLAVGLALLVLATPIITGTLIGNQMPYARGGGAGMMPSGMTGYGMGPGMMYGRGVGSAVMPGAMAPAMENGWIAGTIRGLNAIGNLAFWGTLLVTATFL